MRAPRLISSLFSVVFFALPLVSIAAELPPSSNFDAGKPLRATDLKALLQYVLEIGAGDWMSNASSMYYTKGNVGIGAPPGTGTALDVRAIGNNKGLMVWSENPKVPGQGVSFGSPLDVNVHNGAHFYVKVDGSAARPTNGVLINNLVNQGYASPFVGLNVETQFNGTHGDDYWGIIGVNDYQNPNAAGNVVGAIVRGHVGLPGHAFAAVAENESGRDDAGLFIAATTPSNAFDKGVFVRASKTYGVLVSDEFAPPTYPFAFTRTDTRVFYVDSSGGVHTPMLCIGSTCVTEAQLKQLLGQ